MWPIFGPTLKCTLHVKASEMVHFLDPVSGTTKIIFFCCVCKVPRQAGSRSQGRAKYLISFLFIACRKIASMVGHSSPLSGLDHSAGELVHSAGELLHAPSSTRRRRRAVPSSPEALHARSWRLPPQPMGPRRRRQSRQYRHRHGL